MNKLEILQWCHHLQLDEFGSFFEQGSHDAQSIKTSNKLNNKLESLTKLDKKNNMNGFIKTEKEVDSSDKIAAINALKAEVCRFKDLDICLTANNVVFSEGPPSANIMLVGEAPGAEEDKRGIPFCGRSGKLLDKMLEAINLSRRTNAYITNTVFWRPPNNRRPTSKELDACMPFVERHISIIKPKLIILVGATAVESLLGKPAAMHKIRQKIFFYANQHLDSKISCTAIFHPSYLLRQPNQKKLAWEDLKFIEKYIKENLILS